MLYLLIDDNSDPERTRLHKDRYRLFTDPEKLMAAATLLGWRDPFGMGLTLEPGIREGYACGDVDLKIMTIEPE